jgi:GH25 family lysozyme M1 (1,4-beta-N-acetylmuramidase)
MTNPEIVEWIRTAPGVALNPDRRFGLQCVDAVDQYAQDIFGVPWNVCVGGVMGAKQLLDVAPDEYWIRINNDPGNPNQMPIQGDVVVFGGSSINEWGHTAVVDTADQNGMWVVQQDGFAAPLIQTPDGLFSNKPAHRAWLNYYSPGTGMILGWLRPRENKIINYKAPSAPTPAPSPSHALLPFQRTTQKVDKVGYRKTPSVNGELIQWLEPDHTYDFKGFVNREGKTWFVGKYTGGFAWNGGFVDEGTHDLPDLTNELFPPAPVPAPAPVPTPAPTPAPTPTLPPIVTTGPHLNGIDISSWQEKADLRLLSKFSDFFIIKASEGGSNWADPALVSNVQEARETHKPVGFYHFARPLATEANTAAEEARSFLAVIKPHMQEGDLLILDWEAENQNRTDWAMEWLTIVEESTGALPLIYLNAKGINGGDWSEVEAVYPLWFAGGSLYDTVIEPWRPRPVSEAQVSWEAGVRMWQYTQKGRMVGVDYDADLDFNVWYGDEDDWLDLGVNLNHATPVPSEPAEPPVVPAANERDILIRYATAQIDAYLASRS